MGDNCDGVRRGDESALSVDHVTVTISITGSTEVDIVFLDRLDKAVRIGQVRIWVSSAKVRRRNTVLDRRLVQTELVNEQSAGIWASNTVQAIEKNTELRLAPSEELLDEIKIENLLEKGYVVGNGIDDGDSCGSV